MTRFVIASPLLALLLAACGGSGGSAGPCDGLRPDPACSTPCLGNDDRCPVGFYCGPQGTCTADCTPYGGECGTGNSCDNRGHCFPDDSLLDASACPNVTVSPMPRIPSVQLLIDQSGSMTQRFGNTDRWNAVKSALISSSGVITTLQDRVVFGASLYTYDRNQGATCPRITKTPMRAINNRGAIATLLDGASPSADTPTGESIQKVIQDFQANPPPPNSVPIILLATDGEPDRCADPDAHDATSRQLSVTAAQQAFTAGIRTIVLSVGDEVGDDHLQQVANAGAGQPIATGTAQFYKANNPAELSAALSSIITGVLSCEFDLSGTVDVSRAAEGYVEMSGGGCSRQGQLTFGTDWEMVDDDTIRIRGGACDALKAGACTLQATFACGIVVD